MSKKLQQSSTTSISNQGNENSGDLSPKSGDLNPGNGGKPKKGHDLGGGDKSGWLNGGDNSGDLSPMSGDLSPKSGDLSHPGNGGKPKKGHDLGGGDKSGWLNGGDNSGDLSPMSGDLSHPGNGSKPKKGHGNDLGGGDKSGWLNGGDNSGDLSPKSGDLNPGNGDGNVPPLLPPGLVTMGTVCNDTLIGGNSGRDILVGTPARGVGEQDTLIGSRAKNTFVLGDDRGSFYLGQGDADYAKIQNFNRCDDLIVLSGSAQDYSISYTQGVASIYQRSSCDLVAKIDTPCSPLDLSANYFEYVPQSCGDMI